MSYDKKDLRTYSKDQLVELLTTDIAGWNKLFQEARKASGYSWSANLRNADLRSANLRSANLRNADLWSANLRSANLRSANLRNADLGSANLRSADLWSANLRSANLRNANLWSADLWSADLRSANLRSANLGNADLRSANLRNADLWSADLWSADLRSANLRNADLDGEPITVESWCDLLDLPRCGTGSLRIAYKRLPEDRITGRNQNQGKNLIEWKPGRWVEAPDWNDSESCGGGLHLSPSAYATRTYSSESLVIVVAFDPADAVLLGDKIKVKKAKVVA